MKKLGLLVPIALAGGLIWFYRAPILGVTRMAENRYFPCASPIPYTIGKIDPQFHVSQAELLAAVQGAESLWEKASSKDLLMYDPNGAPGDLVINLVYDERQAATDRLKALGIAIDANEQNYKTLSAKFNSEKASYATEKANLDILITEYNKRKSAYETKVAYWNARGGASGATYQGLEAERRSLNAAAANIKIKEDALNTLADDVNSLVTVLNRVAADLNITARKYNTEGAGQEFEEGVFKSTPTTREIDIYQFDDRAKLIRVLAHELGHALGLEHVDDPQAIMYRLNQGQNSSLTATDISEIKNRCGIVE